MSSAASDSAITQDDHGATRGCLHPLVREFLDVRHADCMEVMATFPDKHFDLAIVDPPYGNESDATKTHESNSVNRAADRVAYKQFAQVVPGPEYFAELARVARKWIIWGGNFFPVTGGVIAWDKNGTAFGEGEIAVCNTHNSVRFFEHTWNGMIQQDMANKERRIHPTQKPVALYNWLLANYAKPGYRILDTHLGSGSHAIACHYARLHLTACEIDADYFREACGRITRETAQDTFDFPNSD